MPDLLIRDLEDDVVERLQRQAERHRHSLESEVKVILRKAAPLSADDLRSMFDEFDRRTGYRVSSDSAELVREDRER